MDSQIWQIDVPGSAKPDLEEAAAAPHQESPLFSPTSDVQLCLTLNVGVRSDTIVCIFWYQKDLLLVL